MEAQDFQAQYVLNDSKSRDRRIGESPVLAAAFGECSDRMSYLCVASLNLSEFDVHDEVEFASQLLASLKTWGDDTGAGTQALDHKLRLSRDLKTQTLGLLEGLARDIETGKPIPEFRDISLHH